MPTPPRPGDANYGSAPEGSLSEERAKKAALWVEKEVYKLLGEIQILGKSSGNTVQVTFGELFVHYQDVSDTLVGIMARAKKRGLIEYQGQGGHMLFQGKHDKVVVTLYVDKSNQWRREYEQGTLSGKSESPADSSSGPKKPTVKEQYEEEKKKRLSTSPASNVSTPSAKPSPIIETPPTRMTSPPPAPVFSQQVQTPRAIETNVESHSGFLSTMMGKLLTSPKGSNPASEIPDVLEEPPKSEPTQENKPEHKHEHKHEHKPEHHKPEHYKPEHVPEPRAHAPTPSSNHHDDSAVTRSIMSNLSKLLPSHGSSEIDDSVANAIKISANKAKVAAAAKDDTQLRPIPNNTHHAPLVHAALPQRTRDGTRGAVLKTPHSPTKPARPISVPPPTSAAPSNISSGPLKKEQEDWAKKHLSRPAVVQSSTGAQGAYAKLTAFQDDSVESKHKSMPASVVMKKADVYEKTKQSATLPTGLQKRFAWE